METKSIDITAKTSGGRSEIVSLRQNERIYNLRALVAVRFEEAIDKILLVYGGQLLRDVGTIAYHGITSGVTVHVVFRPLPKPIICVGLGLASSGRRSGSNTKANSDKKPQETRNKDPMDPQFESLIAAKSKLAWKLFLENPGVLREVLQNDIRFKGIIEENAQFRYYLNSDRNLREIISVAFNPAKVQELGRRRDLYMLRMESMPGGYKLLDRINNFMCEAYENTVALRYQRAGRKTTSNVNPQRGYENNEPLPNPWKPKIGSYFDVFGRKDERLSASFRQKFEQILRSRSDDIWNSVAATQSLNGPISAERILECRMQRRQIKPMLPQQPVKRIVDKDAGIPSMATSKMSNAIPLNALEYLPSHSLGFWEQRFSSQTKELDKLGFSDRHRNISALLIASGNIENAVKLLEKWKRV
ncbi:ubiquilin-2 [Scaptodrosophila lebanonensis]|uniref:Ubiquilin-2 n=1 Tax=Drosophila lebanonensis TaxID=7225 RepID=A0A6J2T3K2_DROLE|nr:ubiquilin-2 [Scaptodrosophila lebanonensis]